MAEKMNFPVSLAYAPKEQFRLAWFLMQFTMDDDVQASPPEFYTDGVLRQIYGHCPADSGACLWFRIVGEEVWIYDSEVQDEFYTDDKDELEVVMNDEPYVKINVLNEENVNLAYDGIRAYLRGDL